MDAYAALLRPALFRLPAETAHDLAMAAMVARGLLPVAPPPSALSGCDLTVRLAGLTFPNPIGLAAGLDKDARAVRGLFGLGFGAVEVGTLTPRPQPGNPRPRLFRLPEHRALINRMGFNNQGAEQAARRLARLGQLPGPLGINLGKNYDTPLDGASVDYVAGVDALAALGDYLVVNASSPNTPGLRGLQEPEQLQRLLREVMARLRERAPGKPLFLKIAPDLADGAVDEIVEVAIEAGLAGIIATNTTLQRPVEHPLCAQAGGLSGAPLRPMADHVLARAHRRARGRLVLVGVGGISGAEDVYAKLRAGASLVQVYTGFIYGGPGWPRRLLRELAGLLVRQGHHSVEEVIGLDAQQG